VHEGRGEYISPVGFILSFILFQERINVFKVNILGVNFVAVI